MGLVSSNTSPGCMPPLRITPLICSSINPLMAKPSANSVPSPVCPPTRAQPAALSTFTAPAIICVSKSSTLRSSPGGTVTMAVAVCGSAPMANTSPSAWLAATCPNTYGSSMKARKKSTVCTTALPGGTRTTAASSGECRPMSTSLRSMGSMAASARDNTFAPTLAPQPPQRMAKAEIACKDSSALRANDATAGGRSGAISGNSVNLRMKLRSMWSFQRHTQSPAKPSAPRDATACWSPVEISDNQSRCGR